MKTAKEIENKAIYLQKCIRQAENSWMPSKTDEMQADKLKQEAYKLYWAHSEDVSAFEPADAQALKKELERIRIQEEKANDYVDKMLTGDVQDFRFYDWKD